MIKIGDKVKFLNDVGGGVVTRFLNKNMVMVENHDGFEIPYPVLQLLNTSDPELNAGSEKIERVPQQQQVTVINKIEENKGAIIKGKESPDFYFCIVPTDSTNPIGGEIELFLVNDSNFTVLYHYLHFKNGVGKSLKHGTVQPNLKAELESLLQNDLSELPEFGFQLLFFLKEENDWHEPIVKRFKINPVKFYKETSFHPNQFFRKNAIILQISKNILTTGIDKLTEDDFKKLVKEKEIKPAPEKPVQKRTEEIVEIDLHINELLDNSTGLSNSQILEIQKEKIESEMKLAVQTGVKKIVFIHGIGQGVLKQEVINLLKTKFKKYYFQDASFKEYGYGATLVILRK
ncbi:MAG: DNA mismatch repair [Prolixibacteraceae bacterium]|nr:MAG: DNA mismatch repair [Prolixibacteraceae bacterium]